MLSELIFSVLGQVRVLFAVAATFSAVTALLAADLLRGGAALLRFTELVMNCCM